MSNVVDMLKQAAAAEVLANPTLVKALIGGSGLLVGGDIGANRMHARDEKDRMRDRNIAFGSGAATGLATPRIIDALHTLVHQGDA